MDNSKIKLGIAPIGWTNDDLPELGRENTFEQCVSEMALAGFSGSEVGNKYPKDTVVLQKALDLRGLTICNAWFSSMILAQGEDKAIEAFIAHRDFLHTLGAKVIGCSEQSNSIQGKPVPIFDKKPVFSDSDWDKVIHGFNRMADLAEEKNMKFCVHHHMGTEIQTPNEIDILMEKSNDNVYLLFDTGHLMFSEGDPQVCTDVLKKHINRTAHIHLKDIRLSLYEHAKAQKVSFLEAVSLGVFTVPGDGDYDFRPVFKIIENSKYSGWLVVEAEQDPAMANPLEYALKARKYISETAEL